MSTLPGVSPRYGATSAWAPATKNWPLQSSVQLYSSLFSIFSYCFYSSSNDQDLRESAEPLRNLCAFTSILSWVLVALGNQCTLYSSLRLWDELICPQTKCWSKILGCSWPSTMYSKRLQNHCLTRKTGCVPSKRYSVLWRPLTFVAWCTFNFVWTKKKSTKTQWQWGIFSIVTIK
jgi:hypothetical protein